MLSELKQWLDSSTKNYETGLDLLAQSGEDKFTYDLCKKFPENSFTKPKLHAALKSLFEKLVTSQPPEPSDEKNKQPVANEIVVHSNSESIKDTIIRLMEEKSKLFKEVLNLRKQLKKTHPLLYRGTIDLGSALDIMDTYDRRHFAVPFSIVCFTYNDALQTGGEVLYYPKAQLAVLDKSNRLADGKRAQKISNKNPNHWVNGTRNICPYDDNQIRTISIWTIIQFNEMEVTLGNIG